MTTRAGGRSIYVRGTYVRSTYIKVEHVRETGSRVSPLLVITVVLSCLLLVTVFFFLTSVYEDARAQYMESLKKEKQIIEINKALKRELEAVTQKGYVEFAARERLGLKPPKEEEVVVLR
jgi:cell division protein FtsL